MKHILAAILVVYTPRYPKILVYMLQNTEYQVWPYLKWFWRTQDFNTVVKRRKLEPTRSAKLLVLALSLGMAAEILLGVFLLFYWQNRHYSPGIYFGVAIIMAYPVVWSNLIAIPLFFGRQLLIKPEMQKLIKQSEYIFKRHRGLKIAIAGSYGKTTMKELLTTVLSQGKSVAATPANKNVPISHAQFAKSLTGKEDILIIEYGEGAPGDVARFTATTHPDRGVITGLAPAHLDRYKTLQAAGEDIFYLADHLKGRDVYVNGESPNCRPFIKKNFNVYDRQGALGWKVSDVKVDIKGTSFILKRGRKSLKLHSGLLGEHNVGPLSLAAALGHELGLTYDQIIRGIRDTKPFEHRMQPYLLSGAWVIDDTYNGNIEGIQAGTKLLAALPARRKLYVTPGLVDQGEETEVVHTHMGELISQAQPDMVILMKNSTTPFIQNGLTNSHFKGQIRVETDPVHFYANLGEFVAAGDLVLMQNDWPDNYA